MTTSNIILQAAAEFGTEHSFTRRSSTWYRRQQETIAVFNIQRSRFGKQFYVNVALWLLPLGDQDYPREPDCHVRTRLPDLMNGDESQLDDILNLDFPMPDAERRKQLIQILVQHMLPVFELSSTINGLMHNQDRLLAKSLITGPAQQLLKGSMRQA